MKREYCEGFDPVYDGNSVVLILGSFPSVKSRAEGFYYGNKQNRFWRTVSVFFGAELPKTVEEKRAFVLRNRIALWDVVTACEIEGSQDSSIVNERIADIPALLEKSNIKAILCNGTTAYGLLAKNFPALVAYCKKASVHVARQPAVFLRELGVCIGGHIQMITYEEALNRLYACADEKYRAFHKRLLKNDAINVIGVRTPVLRALAKEWKGDREIFSFPDEYYEISFLKCAVASLLPFDQFVTVVDTLVDKLDNWATCDCFAPKCIAKHKEEFLPFIRRYLQSEREFTRRYGLVALLHDYVEREYLPVVFGAVVLEEDAPYYVMMASAWLIAEVLTKFYDDGVAFLKETPLPETLFKKAVQKARESYRLTREQKEELKRLTK